MKLLRYNKTHSQRGIPLKAVSITGLEVMYRITSRK